MKHLELKKGIHWIGALDPDLRIFDIIMYTEFGTTYNSYLVQGNDKIAVIETVKVKYWEKYKETLASMIDISKIDYIVVDHTEPDHVGSVANLLALAPNAKVVGSNSAIKFLRAIANRDFESITVNTGDVIDLGGKTLQFIAAPFLHWPDSIYTYVPEDKVIFTCDSFGAHYALDDILSSKIVNHDDYMSALKYYFNMIMGPFKQHMLNAIAKIEPLEIEMICNGHGPVLDKDPMAIVALCKEWSTESNPNPKKTIVMPYVSAYGYTETLANEIEKGILAAGDIDVKKYDMVYANFETVMGEIRWADGLLLGSPTINSEALPPIWNILVSLSPIVHGRKHASAFGSYGWSGEAVPNIIERLKQVRMQVIPGLKVNFKPSSDELADAYEFGLKFGNKLLGIGAPDVNVAVVKKPAPVGDGMIKKWRCVICNEVFDGTEPPEICPACGASHEQFEEYIETKVTYQSDTSANIVIVGGGAAAVAAAESIRKRNTASSIELISNESDLPYYRPMLSDYISGTYNQSMFYLHDQKWYEDNNIKLTLGKHITEILPQEKCVVTAEGNKINYDKLILANGSNNFIPNITDIQKKGVFTLKNKADADLIITQAKSSKRAVVIGGGLLGLEIAWELKNFGLEVSVVEFSDRILPRQLDVEGSEVLESGIEKVGIKVYKSAVANSIVGNESATGVELLSGEIIPADLVIVQAGVRPDKAMAEKAGILTNIGIQVDSNMKTNIEDIYACGDVTEFENMAIGIWPVALEQGKVAGANTVGDTLEYKHTIPSNIFNGMDLNIFSIGDIGKEPNQVYETVVAINKCELTYKKLYFINSIFVGGILIGDVTKSAQMIRGINKGMTESEMIKEVLI